jgi:hypothetical protein
MRIWHHVYFTRGLPLPLLLIASNGATYWLCMAGPESIASQMWTSFVILQLVLSLCWIDPRYDEQQNAARLPKARAYRRMYDSAHLSTYDSRLLPAINPAYALKTCAQTNNTCPLSLSLARSRARARALSLSLSPSLPPSLPVSLSLSLSLSLNTHTHTHTHTRVRCSLASDPRNVQIIYAR